MKARYLIFSVVALFLCSACQSLMNLMPEVPMEKRQVVYDKAEAMAFPKARKLGRSKDRRMDLKSGQWITVLHENLQGDMNVTLTTTKVISVKGSTVVLEMETISAADDALPVYSQITMENYPVKGRLSYSQEAFDKLAANLRIISSVSKHGDGPVNETPPQLLAMSQGMAQKALAGSMVRLDEPQRVPHDGKYIKTQSCFAHDYTVSVMGITTHGRCLTHSSIPVSGTIFSEDDQSKATTIAYGYKGATSVF